MQTSQPHDGGARPLHRLRMGGYQSSESILTRSLQHLAQALPQSTGFLPQLQIDVTSTGEPAQSLFDSVDAGERELCYVASSYLTARVPELAVLDIPFSITDRAAALRALDGEPGQYLTAAVERRTGYKVLGFWDNGFRHLTNGVRPIRRPSDCAGLIVRTLNNASYQETFEALGLQARVTDVKDLVRAIQAQEVHGQENPLTNFMNFALWKYHPYVSLTGHFFGVLLLTCHRRWHDGLPQSQQDALRLACRQATRLQRELAAAEDDTLVTELGKLGIQILSKDDLDLEAMRRATAPIARRLQASLPSALIEGYLQYR